MEAYISMAKLLINVNDKEKLNGLELDNVTIEAVLEAVEQKGSIDIPIDVLVILSDMRCPNNKYGAFSSKKMVLEWSGINADHKNTINSILRQYEWQKGLLYMDVFNSLDTKTFEAYVEALNGIIRADMPFLIEKVASNCNISHSLAEDFLNVYMALRTYNGFIMEYLITQMLLLSNRYDVLEQLNINGSEIDNRALDKDYGIDVVAAPIDVTEVTLPLQLKAQTNFRVKREYLQKTFDNHKQYKKLYDNLKDKECKGNVYYLHYDMHSLRVALIQNRQFTYALPMSKELEHMVVPNPIFKYVEIWDVMDILDNIVGDLCYNVLDRAEITKGVRTDLKENNINFVRFYKE